MLKRSILIAAASLSVFACSNAAPEETTTTPSAPVETTATTPGAPSSTTTTTSTPAPVPVAPAVDTITTQRDQYMAVVSSAVFQGTSKLDSAAFTSWAYQQAGITAVALPTAVGTQGCDPWAGGALFDVNSGNIDATESALRAGDLLFLRGEDSSHIAHVVTWTGRRWNDVQGEVGEISATNPYVIVDSTAGEGPSYRPFTGTYKTSLTHIRRIIGATAATSDAILAGTRIQFESLPGLVEHFVAAPPSGGFIEVDTFANTCERTSK